MYAVLKEISSHIPLGEKKLSRPGKEIQFKVFSSGLVQYNHPSIFVNFYLW